MPRTRRQATVETTHAAPAAVVSEVHAEPDPNGNADGFRLPACISERQLKSLLRTDEEYKGQVDTLTGEQRAAISNATERQHLHKGGYSMLKKLRKCKTAEQKAMLFYTFLEYVKLSGELRIIEAVPSLPLDDTAAPQGQVVQLHAAE